MNNKNFDKLMNIEVPQSWIDNAINIPNVVPKKKPLLFPKVYRYLAAVACLVLVCTVSLVIVLNIDKNIVPVKPMVSASNSGDNSNTTEPTEQGDVMPTLPDERPTDSQTQKPVNPTNPDDTKPSEPGNEPSEEPTGKPTEAPSENPTDKPINPDDKPPVDPTYPPTSPPAPPTDEPTDAPTDAPADEPWDPVDPWDPPQSPPNDPTAPPPSDYPSSGYPPYGSDVFIQYNVYEIAGYAQTGKIYIYCEITGPDGYLIGSMNSFDTTKLVTIYQVKNDIAYGAYSIKNTFNITEHGRYTAYFYDSDGKSLGIAHYIY